jgi:hypothetical protein
MDFSRVSRIHFTATSVEWALITKNISTSIRTLGIILLFPLDVISVPGAIRTLHTCVATKKPITRKSHNSGALNALPSSGTNAIFRITRSGNTSLKDPSTVMSATKPTLPNFNSRDTRRTRLQIRLPIRGLWAMFTRAREYHDHMAKEHGEGKIWGCEEKGCYYATTIPVNFHHHRESCHIPNSQKKYRCSFAGCDFGSWNPSAVKVHEETHVDGFYGCPEEGCGSVLKTTNSLQGHVRRVHSLQGVRTRVTREQHFANFLDKTEFNYVHERKIDFNWNELLPSRFSHH